MSENPLVSVVLPVWGVEKYVRDCLLSIYNQTYKNIEIIVIDDCSPDNSLQICQEVGNAYGKMTIIRNEKNSGVCISRDKGLMIAQGKYVMITDSDDTYYPGNMLEYLVNVAENSQADVVHSPGFFREVNGQMVTMMHESPWNLHIQQPFYVTHNIEERISLWTERKIYWNTWNKMFRRQFLLDNDIKMINDYGEDAFFCFRCLYFAQRYVRIPVPIYMYRDNPISLTYEGIKDSLGKRVRKHCETFKLYNEFMKSQPYFSENTRVRKKLVDFFVRGVARALAFGAWKYNHGDENNEYLDELERAWSECYGEEAGLYLAGLFRLCEKHTRDMQHWLG